MNTNSRYKATKGSVSVNPEAGPPFGIHRPVDTRGYPLVLPGPCSTSDYAISPRVEYKLSQIDHLHGLLNSQIDSLHKTFPCIIPGDLIAPITLDSIETGNEARFCQMKRRLH